MRRPVGAASTRRATATAQGSVTSLLRGYVVEAPDEDGRVWVRLPHVMGNSPLGPFPSRVRGLQRGEAVVVGAFEDRMSDLFVLGRLAGEPPAQRGSRWYMSRQGQWDYTDVKDPLEGDIFLHPHSRDTFQHSSGQWVYSGQLGA